MTTKFSGWPLARLRFHIDSGLLGETDSMEMVHELMRRIDVLESAQPAAAMRELEGMDWS